MHDCFLCIDYKRHHADLGNLPNDDPSPTVLALVAVNSAFSSRHVG